MLLLSHSVSNSYTIIDTYTAGIQLVGFEVKSLKLKKGSIKGAFVRVFSNGAWIEKMQIPPYQTANTAASYNQFRSRKLLLTKPQLRSLVQQVSQKGLTILPTMIHNDNGRITVTIALVRHMNKHDKRDVIKKKDAAKEIARTLKMAR